MWQCVEAQNSGASSSGFLRLGRKEDRDRRRAVLTIPVLSEASGRSLFSTALTRSAIIAPIAVQQYQNRFRVAA